MKMLSLLAAILLAGATGAALAQDAPPAQPGTDASDASQSPAGAPQTLFPDAGPAGPPAVGRAAGAGAGTGGGERGLLPGARRHARRNTQYATDLAMTQANADPLDVRIRYRKDKTLALLRQPELVTYLQQADAAPTDDKKRAFLRLYYVKLFDTIRKIDRTPEMKAHVALLSQVSLQRYDPRRRAVSGEDSLAGAGRRGGRNRR